MQIASATLRNNQAESALVRNYLASHTNLEFLTPKINTRQINALRNRGATKNEETVEDGSEGPHDLATDHEAGE
jgi:hypothetical protein